MKRGITKEEIIIIVKLLTGRVRELMSHNKSLSDKVVEQKERIERMIVGRNAYQLEIERLHEVISDRTNDVQQLHTENQQLKQQLNEKEKTSETN